MSCKDSHDDDIKSRKLQQNRVAADSTNPTEQMQDVPSPALCCVTDRFSRRSATELIFIPLEILIIAAACSHRSRDPSKDCGEPLIYVLLRMFRIEDLVRGLVIGYVRYSVLRFVRRPTYDATV